MLPVELTRYFHDSWLTLETYSGTDKSLTIRIEKDIGPETGTIVFRQVSYLSLPTSMPGETINSRPIGEAGPEFWSLCRLVSDWFEADDVVFEIESQDGQVYIVVAKSVGYEVTNVRIG